MFNQIRKHIWEISILSGLLLTILFGQVAAFAETCEAVRTDTLRLHILANSDSKEDQRLKLLVRDEILRQEGTFLSKATDKENAALLAKDALPRFQKTAEETLRRQGCGDEVKVQLCRQYFTTRHYENFTLPAGEYDAVQIIIGEGRGHNWWCVLFPTLCLPASSGENQMEPYTEEEKKLVQSGKYEVRFALVELAEAFFQK